ncbi:hypothetical protein CONCODRAFT_79160 [Conidiobolus coronatus NRRL 28638]|uniref:Integrator complex subunit 7 N-terminal domain-containing protein n=1 Tax=Conidiobolus coronatus (strain ATCC 28846 / CBS 209.66 / NRRL 28638) TaxID=796925 RepID=A0A137P428_CONC2|nr:hypothetical protein CONCODRAFT_79160 [Conidiobolus coronatus NRRL 28638]|eukprot:KXN69765.1 hypothetical protein CONCODRAFT_79160 [Conidiobolus coronatus NRRL 28638]
MDQFSATTTHYLNTLGPKSTINFSTSTEVEMKLTSPNYDYQTHAIIWVPHYLNQHPDPVTINEWTLKLTRQFSTSTSPIKLLIIEALAKIKPLLIKVFNVDQVFQNLASLLNTSKEISIEDKVLTLRSLNSIHSIIKDNLKYHQLIINLINIGNLHDLDEELVWTCLECIESISIDSSLGREMFLDLMLELSALNTNYQVTAINILRHFGSSMNYEQVYKHCISLFDQIDPEDAQMNTNTLKFAIVSTLTRLTQVRPRLMEDYSVFLKSELKKVNHSSYLRILYDNLIELLKDPKIKSHFRNDAINNEWCLIIQETGERCDTPLNETKYLMAMKYLLMLRSDRIEGLEWGTNEMQSYRIHHLPISLYAKLFKTDTTPTFSRTLISNQLLTRLLIMHVDSNSIDQALPYLKLNQSNLFNYIQPKISKDKLILVLRSLKFQIQFILKFINNDSNEELIEIIVNTLVDLLVKFSYQKEVENSKLLDRWTDSLIPQLLEIPNLIQNLQTKLSDKAITNIRLIRLGLLTFSTSEIAEQSPTRSDKVTLPKVPLLDKLLSITIPNSIHIPILMDCFKLHFKRGHYSISLKIITIIKQYQPTISNQLQRLCLNYSQLTEFEAKYYQKNYQNNYLANINFNELEGLMNQLKQFGFELMGWVIELRIVYLKALEGLFALNTKLNLNSFQVKKVYQQIKYLMGLVEYWSYLEDSYNFWFNLSQLKWVYDYLRNIKGFISDSINQLSLIEYAKYYKLSVIVNDLEQFNKSMGIEDIKMETDFKPLNDSELEELTSNFQSTLKSFYEATSSYPPIFFTYFNNSTTLSIELPPFTTYNPNNLYTIEYARDHRLILRFNGKLKFNSLLTTHQKQLIKSGNLFVKINIFELRKFINFNATSLQDQFQFYKLGCETPKDQCYLSPIKLSSLTNLGGSFDCDILIPSPITSDDSNNTERIKLRLNKFENTLFWNLGFRFSIILKNSGGEEDLGLGQSVLSLIRFRLK